jgi:Uma2 family endonuclease
MQVVLPDVETRATFEIRAERPMDEAEYFEFCARNPELRIERNAHGEIIIMPRAGAETGFRNSDLTAQLAMWSKQDGRGRAFDSNAEYILPDGARYRRTLPGCRAAGWSSSPRNRRSASYRYVRISWWN